MKVLDVTLTTKEAGDPIAKTCTFPPEVVTAQ